MVSTLPEPPHFVQLLPSFAASTQQPWVQALPSLAALVQQPALVSAFSAAKATPAAARAKRATNDLRDFMMVGWDAVHPPDIHKIPPLPLSSPSTTAKAFSRGEMDQLSTNQPAPPAYFRGGPSGCCEGTWGCMLKARFTIFQSSPARMSVNTSIPLWENFPSR